VDVHAKDFLREMRAVRLQIGKVLVGLATGFHYLCKQREAATDRALDRVLPVLHGELLLLAVVYYWQTQPNPLWLCRAIVLKQQRPLVLRYTPLEAFPV
jgi:hypothetical protein